MSVAPASRSEFLVVIPAFNEAPTIAQVVGAARRRAPVLVVDDGSTDGTGAAARAAGADVLGLGRRRGKGGALLAGVDVARGRGSRWVITLDGDGQHDAADIPLLVAAARTRPDALVVGGRLARGRTLPRERLNACRVAGFFINWITGVSIRDTQSGFRCYPARLFGEVGPRSGGFVVETELLVACARRGRPLVEVDIRPTGSPVRPSRFRPVADGCAVGAYLAARVIEHGLREAGAAVREAARVFGRERLRIRHGEMAEAGACCGDALPLYGIAIAGAAVRRARARVVGWWRHPRRRGGSLGLAAIATAPALLAAAVVQPLLTRLGADAVTPLVNRFYSQERLATALAPVMDVGRVDRPLPRVAPGVTVSPPG